MARLTARRVPRFWVHPLGTGAPGVIRCPMLALALFFRQNVPGMAAMIAFFGFLALVPLVLLLLAFLGHLVGNTVSGRDVQELFHRAIPGLTEQQFQRAYWHPIERSQVATTVLGAVSLLLGSLGLHDAVDWAVNRLWESPVNRSFLIMKLRGLAIILWVIAFAFLSLASTWLLAEISGIGQVRTLVVVGWLALLPAILLDIAVFAALYKLTPTIRVRWSTALTAALVAAMLWDLSKLVFGWWVIEAGTYNRVYGPLAASVIVMLWLWVSGMIFLYGAALAVVLQRDRPPAPSPARRFPAV